MSCLVRPQNPAPIHKGKRGITHNRLTKLLYSRCVSEQLTFKPCMRRRGFPRDPPPTIALLWIVAWVNNKFNIHSFERFRPRPWHKTAMRSIIYYVPYSNRPQTRTPPSYEKKLLAGRRARAGHETIACTRAPYNEIRAKTTAEQCLSDFLMLDLLLPFYLPNFVYSTHCITCSDSAVAQIYLCA